MINKVFILGELAKKEFKTTVKGAPLCVLEVVTNKNFTDSKENKKSIATRHIINCFGILTNVTNKYAEIGDVIFIEGEIINKKIEDNGIIKIMHSITAHEIKVLTLKNKKGNFPYGSYDCPR